VTAYDGAGNESVASNTVTADTPAGPTSKTYTFTATDDATIDLTNPNTNAGTSTSVIADNNPVNDFLLKFDVATTGCVSLTSATLRLTNNANGSTRGGDFYSTGQNWSQGAVTWNNAPTRGALLNSLGAVGNNAVVTVNVTNGVALNGSADFRVGSMVGDGVHYWSKEAATAANRPQLTVVCSTTAPAPDAMAPTAPASVAATSTTAAEIDLKWRASTDNAAPTGYEVFRDGAEVGTVPWDSQSYKDTTVTGGQTYHYTVKAVDAAGNRSQASNTVTVTSSTTPPPAPTNLQARVAGPTVHLDWAPGTGQSVVGFRIYRGPAGGTLALIDSTNKAKYVDKPPSGTYDYAVTAVTVGGVESARSNIVTVTVR
jgi:fibronectin type 3 domain-containing protein